MKIVDLNAFIRMTPRDKGKYLSKLTTPQIFLMVEEAKKFAAGLGGAKIPDDPASFAQWLDPTYKIPPHIELISKKLVQGADGKLPRLIVSVHPRSGKSELIARRYPLWVLARNPRKRIMYISYEEGVAVTNCGRPCKDAVLTYGDKLNIRLSKDKDSAQEWQTSEGGGLVCLGAGGAVVGRGADLLILDDVIKGDEEARSQLQREKLWQWWQVNASTRLQPGASVVCIGTRYHEDDFIGRLVKASESGEGVPWESIRIPAEAEGEDPLGRAKGEWLWPALFQQIYEDQKKSMSPYNWASVYQQRPTPEGGGIIQRDWLKFYKPSEFPSDPDQWIQSWDLALKDKETGSYTVGQLWARKGSSFYLIQQFRNHCPITDVINQVLNWQRAYPKAIAKLVEDKASGPALLQVLSKQVPGFIPITPKGSKKARVEAVVPIFQAGNVFLPEGADGVKPRWVWDWIEEIASFDRGVNDDQVDACSQALSFMLPYGWTQEARDAKASALAEEVIETPAKAYSHQLHTHIQKKISTFSRLIDRKRKGIASGW